MKKILALVLTLCLVLGLVVEAFAASNKPEFTQQPKSATTSKKGTVSFSVKIKGKVKTITWYFINPETGEKITGKKLKNTFKKISVSNPNSKKITLKKVPDEMHGWTVYCHIAGNGYNLDSDPVVLNVYGKDPVTEPVKITSEASTSTSTEDSSAASSGTSSDSAGTSAGAKTTAAAAVEDEEEIEAQDREITVTASDPVLYVIDAMGKATSEIPQTTLTFINTGNFAVRSDEPIKNWTINGFRVEPLEPVNGFNVFNVTTNTAVKLSVVRQTAATAQVDESQSCTVSCIGCAFTYFPKGLISVTDGSVPAGAVITVFSTETDKGYSVNGAEPINQGKASFSLTVRQDTTISMR